MESWDLNPRSWLLGHKLPGTCGPGHGLTWELHAEAAWESTKKTFTQQKTVPSSNQRPSLTPATTSPGIWRYPQ